MRNFTFLALLLCLSLVSVAQSIVELHDRSKTKDIGEIAGSIDYSPVTVSVKTINGSRKAGGEKGNFVMLQQVTTKKTTEVFLSADQLNKMIAAIKEKFTETKETIFVERFFELGNSGYGFDLKMEYRIWDKAYTSDQLATYIYIRSSDGLEMRTKTTDKFLKLLEEAGKKL